MDVNAKAIKNSRLKNGWTQQHLADAFGLSLRTVQRVERYGTASNETVLSIASVMELNLEEIILSIDDAVTDENNVSSKYQQIGVITVALVLGMVMGVGITLTLV
ncbi:helix-turn-helix transcriptional regulator [Shewanella sp. 202IG2-18]|uniref:helix-turn-helix domain-containing protein n=1 Tax=Parashewanella hymeniacidonis TaxID=2807618 RepID=UPI0019616821|nr:helix-turn-helix transcriptional regulator [Parashewanella hymeniacidonis]MBM7074139.1 helix-turn-helix transcriptional regulator [Parashewanella hymeniacidonis]